MTIEDTLKGVNLATALPETLAHAEVHGLSYDSRQVDAGGLFFAFLGHQRDGRQFAPQAMERGALAVVSETPRPSEFAGPWIQVDHGRQALAISARNTYRSVLNTVSITGITGTNGKTTTAYLADSVARAAGQTTAMIGTIEYQLAGQPRESKNTTPESLDLYRIFGELASLGGTQVTMEVSSHALAQRRVHGIPFHTSVFTNLTRDHLDYHGTLEEYFKAKHLLFEGTPPPKYAVLNRDDHWATKIRPMPETEIIWYGLGEGAHVQATNIRADFEGVHFELNLKGRRLKVSSPLLGWMNVHNVLAAISIGLTYDLALEHILTGIATCRAVPGRFERIDEGQPFLVVVDYAHTDDALRNVCAAAHRLTSGRVITLFGCGGDRDRAKRPLMGQAAGEGSDYVVLTSDNPRSEDPLSIMNDALVGLRRQDVPHEIEPDRRAAVRLAVSKASPGDVVLITGKGHETQQVLKDGPIPFDDREVASEILREFGYTRSAE